MSVLRYCIDMLLVLQHEGETRVELVDLLVGVHVILKYRLDVTAKGNLEWLKSSELKGR